MSGPYEPNPYDIVVAPARKIKIYLSQGCDFLIDDVSYLQKIKDAADGTGGGAVTSVAGKTGIVTLTYTDIGGLGSSATHASTDFDAAGAAAAAQAASDPSGSAAAAQAAAIAASIPISYLDTDGTLAANSDTRVSTQKALKTYIDAVAAGLTPKLPVRLATTTALPAGTYNNGSSGVGATFTVTATGTLTIDSVLTALNNRIAVMNQADTKQNGVFKVTTAGAVGVQAVLTRDTDSDSGAALLSAIYGVTAGTVNAGLFFDVTNTTAPVVGTDNITFAQFTTVSQGGSGGVKAGTGLTKSGNTLSVDSKVNSETLVIACSDETTAITTGTAKVTFRMPWAMTLTDVRGSLVTPQTSGSIFTVNIKESGTTIFSTKLTIDNTEGTSTTAATPAVVSDANLADDAVITIDIDQIGDGTAKGLKIALIGVRG